ncbi:MAG: hypothetical protein N838_34060 [Thiohalocapsa sp. PB-PSB1]|nr:MAG: hypothetical protein N838_34060 [Thiohalocapsa sp. PB-PSB1]
MNRLNNEEAQPAHQPERMLPSRPRQRRLGSMRRAVLDVGPLDNRTHDNDLQYYWVALA